MSLAILSLQNTAPLLPLAQSSIDPSIAGIALVVVLGIALKGLWDGWMGHGEE